MGVDWPGRGNRGKNARRQPSREPRHEETQTSVVLSAAAPHWRQAFLVQERYDPDTDTVKAIPVEDRSLTHTQSLVLRFGDKADLLNRGMPESQTLRLKRETSKGKVHRQDENFNPDREARSRFRPRFQRKAKTYSADEIAAYQPAPTLKPASK